MKLSCIPSPAFLLPAAIICLPVLTEASERHFTYSQESAVLAPGDKELEIWSTLRRNRADGFYSAMDNRLEFEIGVTDRVMTAFYINFASESVETSPGTVDTSSEVKGFSWEWKFKLADPVADPVGFALYSEVSVVSDEVELELKAIADKRVERNLFAANLTYEPEVEFAATGHETTHNLEASIGYSFFITPRVALGLEVRNLNQIADGTLYSSTIFAGPTAFWATDSFWAALTVLPQIAALKGETASYNLDLTNHERVEVRLLFSFHL